MVIITTQVIQSIYGLAIQCFIEKVINLTIDLYDLYRYYLEYSNAYFCLETGECFSEKDDVYVLLKDEYSFIKIPNCKPFETMREFILLSDNASMLKLLDISVPIEFASALHRFENDNDLSYLLYAFRCFVQKRELVNWCEANGIKWTHNFTKEDDDEIDKIDFPAEIRKQLEKTGDNS